MLRATLCTFKVFKSCMFHSKPKLPVVSDHMRIHYASRLDFLNTSDTLSPLLQYITHFHTPVMYLEKCSFVLKRVNIYNIDKIYKKRRDLNYYNRVSNQLMEYSASPRSLPKETYFHIKIGCCSHQYQ